ncbi:hypothetical protein CEY16_06505 [Halalkalibacillus sediminis]|uniref:VOC domain-containing protein n=1 Tax=Halalkalibacillus sediminis TaxID=2018042 RepID=A0A2I0QTA8_9BACI|nr:VOC family protein [Halalkalibacillus sediminis]PKR77585.1 hypothetical protein CEY16_06505 [Halalkalibacillus sediminis]
MEIKSVVLQTGKLEEMREFYCEVLGFPMTLDGEDRFSISIGDSVLEYTSSEAQENPFYHFAFNIPPNKFEEAKSWIKERVTLNKEEGKDEVYFDHLNANALYFEDPAGNIVELIARQKVSMPSIRPFSIESIINISEISLVVDDALSVGKEMQAIGVKRRIDKEVESGVLNFMGEPDNDSFVLLLEEGRKWFFSDKISIAYPVEITLDGNRKISLNSSGEVKVSPSIEEL